jgi:hypothetical protein
MGVTDVYIAARTPMLTGYDDVILTTYTATKFIINFARSL